MAGAGGMVPEGARLAISRLCANGGRFVLSTTRPLRSALNSALRLGADMLVCSGGAVVVDPWKARLLVGSAFSVRDSRRLTDVLRSRLDGVRIAFDHRDRCVLDEDFRTGWPETSELHRRARAEVSGAVTKVMVQSDSEDVEILAKKVRAEIGAIGAVAIPGPDFVDVLPPGVDSAEHLRTLVPAGTTTVAFGAAPADVPLLRWADVAVAVADAELSVMDSADYLTAPRDEDGVAQFLDRVLCGQPL
ncbi:hypothetical protein GCM10010470_01170 [Saccharopolyspora taberi]|uniref:Uncharacterized protein n=1 Tax=Saccharopolyspora taberi TaxID=60895 RepID=A0ABN3V425_9PSEU